MRSVGLKLYRRGGVWWAYENDVRWSLGTADAAEARRRVGGRAAKASRCTQGVVYFIRFGEDGPIKIGRAVDVAKRLGCMQTSSPAPLVLLATMPGGPDQERALLRRFRHLRTRGEWHRPEPELLSFVASLRSEAA